MEGLAIGQPDQVIDLITSTWEVDPPTLGYTSPQVRRCHFLALQGLLERLADFDGSWRQRWAGFEQQSTARPWWMELITAGIMPGHAQYFNRALSTRDVRS